MAKKEHHSEFYEKFELLIDRLIPWMILLLLIVIILEFFYHDFVHHYHLESYLKWADWLVVAVFICDLYFKFNRVKKIKDFLKHYWLDIIAVFPFILFFRFLDPIIGAFAKSGDKVKKGQTLLHEGLELEKAGTRAIKEAEIATKVVKSSRFGRFGRFIRPLARLPRFLKYLGRFRRGLHFFEDPKVHHRKKK
tara:strand:- start:13540 stop:14118 length:579 start_codon:yes stop_codon:yes gene_type:complete